MSKLNFKRLSRGVKLLTDHIHSQIQSALTLVTNTRVPEANLQNNAGVTRLSFSWPVAKGVSPKTLSAAFNLAPPQGEFRSDGILDPEDQTFILDELSFSFDVRDEAARITSPTDPSGEGELTFYQSENLAFKVSIFEKSASVFGGDANFDSTLFSLDYPSTLYLGSAGTNRSNPAVLSSIGATLNPYKTYLLAVDCSTYLESPNYQVNSVMVSMAFRSKLRPRDAGEVNVQNIPQGSELSAPQQYGAPYLDVKTLTTPAAGSTIKAEASGLDTGVQGALELVDTSVRSGLTGGYNNKSRRNGYESLRDDSSYQIIAVPMWGNGWYGAATADLPYMGASPFTDAVVDRRIIPIHYPMVIHHVVCCANYSGIVAPTTATYKIDVGVGIGCGIRSDSHSYRQAAFASITNLTTPIDAYSGSSGLGLIDGVRGSLYDIPLVGTGGVGFSSVTGKPFYVGQASSTEQARSGAAETVGGGDVAIASIDGKEQWIEVRMSLQDTAGIGSMPAGQGLIGYGGHWVYIIGKRHVC
jgi:hypothetical protein